MASPGVENVGVKCWGAAGEYFGAMYGLPTPIYRKNPKMDQTIQKKNIHGGKGEFSLPELSFKNSLDGLQTPIFLFLTIQSSSVLVSTT